MMLILETLGAGIIISIILVGFYYLVSIMEDKK